MGIKELISCSYTDLEQHCYLQQHNTSDHRTEKKADHRFREYAIVAQATHADNTVPTFVLSDIRCSSIPFILAERCTGSIHISPRWLLDSVVCLPPSPSHTPSRIMTGRLVSFTTMRPCHSKSLPAGIDECNIRKQVSRGREAGAQSISFNLLPILPCSATPSVFQLNLDRGGLSWCPYQLDGCRQILEGKLKSRDE